MSIQKVRQIQPEISFDEIASAVSRTYLVSMKKLLGSRKDEKVLEAVHMCIFLMRMKTRYSMRVIGAYFRMIDHSSVIYANVKMRRLVNTNDVVFSRMERVLAKIG